MPNVSRITLAFLALFLLGSLVPVSAQQPQMADTEEISFTAQVVDLSCKMVYDLSGEEAHRECAQVCADRGIPLGLLSSDGEFYVPVTDAMPGNGANEQLRPHAEHTVQVTGRVVDRGGMKGIIIDSLNM